MSFEFFPPKTKEGAGKLFSNIQDLSYLKPNFISVTYGANGTTRELTHDLLLRLKKETPFSVISHLTCVGSSKDEIREILKSYDEHGIHNIMALRGDPPIGEDNFVPHPHGFQYAADLVAFIKKEFSHMGIGVAGFPEGHPESINRLKEIEFLKAKVDQGADYICTQLFFDNNDFYDFCERCELAGIKVPIIAGLMPISSIPNLKRIAELSRRARFPAALLRSLGRAQHSDEAVEKVGLHWATEQARDLLDHQVKGIHFYTLNRSRSTMTICESLGINSSEILQDDTSFL